MSPTEDALYALSCRAPLACIAWNSLLLHYWEQLETIDTSPDLLQILQTQLPIVASSCCCSPPDSKSPLSQVIVTQNIIGWTPLLNGRLSSHWRLAQDMWLTQQLTCWKKSSQWWAIRFLRLTMDLLWGMWEHRNAVLHDPTHSWIVGKEAPFQSVYATSSVFF